MLALLWVFWGMLPNRVNTFFCCLFVKAEIGQCLEVPAICRDIFDHCSKNTCFLRILYVMNQNKMIA